MQLKAKFEDAKQALQGYLPGPGGLVLSKLLANRDKEGNWRFGEPAPAAGASGASDASVR